MFMKEYCTLLQSKIEKVSRDVRSAYFSHCQENNKFGKTIGLNKQKI